MDYQSNADKNKIESKPEKQIEKVITGEAKQKPKGIGRKFKDVFLGGDLKTAGRYLLADVMFPALRNLIVDMTSKGVERIVYGESTYTRRPTEYRSRVSYNNPIYSRDPRAINRGPIPDQPHPGRQVRRESNDVLIATKEEAEGIVEKLLDVIDKYQVVSWADLCSMCGWPSSPIDDKWGWTYLTNVEIRQTRDGYLIDLPQLEAI